MLAKCLCLSWVWPLQMPCRSKQNYLMFIFQAVISDRVVSPHNGFSLKNKNSFLLPWPLPFRTQRVLTFLHVLFCFSLSWKHSSKDNHMLVASSVCKWLPTPNGTGHSDKSSYKQSYALSLHAPSMLEINMIPLLSIHRFLCYALQVLSISIWIAAFSQFICKLDRLSFHIKSSWPIEILPL